MPTIKKKKNNEEESDSSRRSSSSSQVLKSSSSWRFVDDLWSLRDRYTDVRLICSGGESVSGHQALLALYSPFLKRLFQEEGIREGKRDPEITLILEDTRAPSLLSLLQLLYTGQPPAYLSPVLIEELESLARMLDIPLPPLEPSRLRRRSSSSETKVEPTRCIHCGVKFEKLKPLKRHLTTCQRAGPKPQMLCLRSCTKPCNRKRHNKQSPEQQKEVRMTRSSSSTVNKEEPTDTSPSPPKDDDVPVEEEEVKTKEEVVIEEVVIKSEEKSTPPMAASPIPLQKEEDTTLYSKLNSTLLEVNLNESTPLPSVKEEEATPNNVSRNGKRKRSQGGDGSGRKRKRNNSKAKDESSKSSNAPVPVGDHGCPLCENYYASPALLREHLCSHFKEELWLIINGFSTGVTKCAICLKDFRKPIIKSVVVRHYGITHLYIRNYLDAEVFDEYFSGQKKAMERRALKLKKQGVGSAVVAPKATTVAVKAKSPPSTNETYKPSPLFARKSAPHDEGVIFSLGNEIRGFMDNDENGTSGNDPTYENAPSNPTPESSIYGSTVQTGMNDLYNSESSFGSFPQLHNEDQNTRSPDPFFTDYHYPVATPSSNGGEFFQSNYTDSSGGGNFFGEQLNFFDNNSYYSPGEADNQPGRKLSS